MCEESTSAVFINYIALPFLLFLKSFTVLFLIHKEGFGGRSECQLCLFIGILTWTHTHTNINKDIWEHFIEALVFVFP